MMRLTYTWCAFELTCIAVKPLEEWFIANQPINGFVIFHFSALSYKHIRLEHYLHLYITSAPNANASPQPLD
eukprot:TsM_000330200 transcript=TsM_000330200 gene=TsM_000330200